MNPNFNNSQFQNRGNYQNPQPMPPSQNPAPYPQMNPNAGNTFQQGKYQPGPYGNNYSYPYPPRQVPDTQQQPQGNNSDNHGSEQKPQKEKKRSGLPVSEVLSRLFVGALTIFIVVYMGWLFAPQIRNSMTFWPTNTPTPVTPSPTIPAKIGRAHV